MHITIALSYFHRKVGPIVYYYYPDHLEEHEKIRIADFMDSAFEESFFINTFDNLISMNYYFEIYSDWARGHREMLMISAIFDQSVSSDIEHEVLAQCIDFAAKLRNNEKIFKAFYNEEDPQYSTEEAENIKRNSELIKLWIKELYWVAVEVAREKSEEETIAQIMKQKSVYELLEFLTNGPVSLEDLQSWYNQKFPDLSFDEIKNNLVKEKFIFINDIGVEVYVLLVKEIQVQRIPPDCVITLIDEQPEMAEITTVLIERVLNFFDSYEPTLKDSLELFNLVADSKIYNVLSQLRQGPISKTKLVDMISKGKLDEFVQHLEKLKEKKIIDEFKDEASKETFILLLNDIQFSTSFPRYLAALIPKETKSQIAKPYQPKRASNLGVINIGSKVEEESLGLNELNDQDLSNLVKMSSTNKKKSKTTDRTADRSDNSIIKSDDNDFDSNSENNEKNNEFDKNSKSKRK